MHNDVIVLINKVKTEYLIFQASFSFLTYFFCFSFLFVFFVCLFVWLVFFSQDRVSLYSPGCPGSHSVDQAGLKLRNLPACASQVLGLKVCTTTPGGL